jgi:hypothetical protein
MRLEILRPRAESRLRASFSAVTASGRWGRRFGTGRLSALLILCITLAGLVGRVATPAPPFAFRPRTPAPIDPISRSSIERLIRHLGVTVSEFSVFDNTASLRTVRTLSIYTVPRRDVSDDGYIRRFALLNAALIPHLLRLNSRIDAFDICQRQPDAAAGSPGDVMTQLYITRSLAATLHWKSTSLASLESLLQVLRTGGVDGQLELYLSPRYLAEGTGPYQRTH